MRACLIAAFGVTWSLFAAAEPSFEARKAELPPLPEKAVSEAVEKWNLQRLAERLGQPGATGQQDVLWEILALCEEKPKARADENLARIVEWLLLDANLWMHPNAMEPAFIKIPVLLPRVGEKLLDRRLSEWLRNVSTTIAGNEPWCWPEFKRIDAAALAAAVRRTAAGASKHNALVRVWSAAVLVAVEDAEGVKELTTARELLNKSYPGQAAQVYTQVLDSLAGQGARRALALLVDEAGRMPEAPRAAEGEYPHTGYRYGSPLLRVYQLLGWPPSEGAGERKVELARVSAWLEKNLDGLTWDAGARRFVSQTPPPGMETLYQAAQAVEKRWGVKCLSRITQPPYEAQAALRDLLSLMSANRQAAEDSTVGDLLMALLDFRGLRSSHAYESRTALFGQLPKINRPLGVRVWAKLLRDTLAAPEPYAGGLAQMQEADDEIVKEACATLVPEYQETYAAARDKGDVEGALRAAMQLLCVGGKPERKEVVELLGKAPGSWGSARGDGLLGRWSSWMMSARRTGYLRLLLISAARDLDGYRPPRSYDHPLTRFQSSCNWTDGALAMAGGGAEVLAVCEAWLDKNEAKLVWDLNRGRFTGALSPMKAALAAHVEALAPYGLKVEEALGSGGGEADMAQRLLQAVLRLAETNAQAAKDPAVPRALLGLVEAGRLLEREQLPGNLLPVLLRLDRASGVRLCASLVDRDLERSVKNAHPDPRLEREPTPGTNPAILKEARSSLIPKYAKLMESAEPLAAGQRLLYAMACIYLGANLEWAKLEKLHAEYLKDPEGQRMRLEGWCRLFCTKGNPMGLRLILLDAKGEGDGPALNMFTQYAGVFGRGGADIFPRLPRDDAARVVLYQRWLDENEQAFVWNAGRHCFDSPIEKLKAMLPPAEQPGARPPPRLPEKAEQNF